MEYAVGGVLDAPTVRSMVNFASGLPRATAKSRVRRANPGAGVGLGLGLTASERLYSVSMTATVANTSHLRVTV